MSDWTTKTPAIEGWYWVQFTLGKRHFKKPAELSLGPGYVGLNIGSLHMRMGIPERGEKPGWPSHSVNPESLRFGPRIEEPE